MKSSFRLSQLAASISLVVGGSLALTPALANTCTPLTEAGTCGLTEYDMTSPLDPKPKAWYFTQPTQDAAINNAAKKQNIYFASGTSSRTAADVQNLLVDGADLSGYYINASKNGSATILLTNNAKVDWLEAGGSVTTNTNIIVDRSTLNGASAATDYDKTNKAVYSKNYARGYAIYLSAGDKGNTDIDIRNGSVINGKILAGGAGTHNISLRDSRMQGGSIVLSMTKDNNAVSLVNSTLDTTGAVVATANAIDITNGATPDKTHAVVIDNSKVTGSVAIASTGSTNTLAVKDSTINKTTRADGSALNLKNGKATLLTLDNSEIGGDAVLAGSESITATLNKAQLNGNLTASKAAQLAMDITASVLTGGIDASAGDTGTLSVKDSTIGATADGNALNLQSGKTTRLTLDNGGLGGNVTLGATESITATMNKAQLDGNLLADNAAEIALDLTNTTLKGGIDAVAGSSNTLSLKDSTVGATADGTALNLQSGKTTRLTLDNGGLGGNVALGATESITATMNKAQIDGNLLADSAEQIALELANATLKGGIDASTGSSSLSVKDSTLGTTADGNAVNLQSSKATRLTLDNSDIGGNVQLAGSESISASLNNTRLNGNLIANNAAQIALDITRSVLKGNIDASAGQGSAALHLTNSTLDGDLNLKGASLKTSDVWLDNTRVAGHLYGSGANSTLHLANTPTFGGSQFSNFATLAISGDTSLIGGFTNTSVGSALTVKGTSVTAPVKLGSGKLTFDNTRLVADTLALSGGASLALTNHSQLQTRSDQLFSPAADSAQAAKYNDTGARTRFSDSTLVLTDAAYQLEFVKSVNSLLGQTAGNTLVMLGTLQNADTAAGTATVIDAATTGAVLANTQVTSAKNQLIIGADKAPTDQAIAVPVGFGASQLRFEGEGKPSVAIGSGQALTLSGAAGALIEVAGAPQTPVEVAVNNGTLNLGVAAMPDVTGHLTGTVTVAPQGTMNVVAGDHTVTSGGSAAGIVSSGLVTVAHQATLHADVALKEKGQLAVTGALLADQLTADKDVQITVGDNTAAGALMAERLDLQGARLFIDPAWTDGGTLADASRVASGGSEINGRVTVGQNALLVLGDTTTNVAESRFADSGLRWGEEGITAAVSIQAPQYLSATQGGLRVDGSLTGGADNVDAAFNTADFADRSLLMVSSKEVSNGQAALNASEGTLNVANRAALYVADAKANQTYTIAKGFSEVNISGSGWQNDNLQLNKLLTATTRARDGEVVVTTEARAAQEMLPGIVTPNALNQLVGSGENSRTAAGAGARYLSIAIDTPQVGVNEVVRTVNSAAQIATAGGVQRNTWAVGNAATEAVLERASVTGAAQQPADTDAGVWVNVLYGNPHTSDLRAGNMRYGQSSNFYGLMLGADKTWASGWGNLRSGAAFHAGNGDSDSRGDFAATHNDFSFWGVMLYQGWQRDSWNLTGDVSLTQTSSDLTQKQPGWMEAGDKLRASVDGSLFSAGLRAEYLIDTGAVDIIPHAGARFNQLTTKAFDSKNGQKDPVFRTDKGTQDIWQFPVGVKLAKTFALDQGWNLHTQADAAVVAVTGDRDSKNRLHTVGVRSSDIITAEVMDETGFNGQLGVKVQKGTMTFGVGYNVSASQHDTDQIVSATYSLAF